MGSKLYGLSLKTFKKFSVAGKTQIKIHCFEVKVTFNPVRVSVSLLSIPFAAVEKITIWCIAVSTFRTTGPEI